MKYEREQIFLVYDKQCPVCDRYCRSVKIRDITADLVPVDARTDSAIMHEITARGFNIDQGMVMKMGDTLYYGADAIHALALISSRSDLFNRMNYRVFKSRTVSSWLYPILRFFRNLLLRILGRTKINNLGLPGNDRF